jgi:nucleotide-binding universal stress UspA family protein
MLVIVTGEFELGTDGPGVIVVGVDGSPTSLRAGAYAAGLARRQNAPVAVVYVQSAPAMSAYAPSAWPAMEETMVEAADEMRAEVEAAASHHGLPVDFHAVRGDPFTEITRIADELRADAVVVGASTRLGHRLIGSLAVRLVQAGRWPVTVVP